MCVMTIHESNTHQFVQFTWSFRNAIHNNLQTICVWASIMHSIVLWDNIPTYPKDLNAFNFSKQLKCYLLSELHSRNILKIKT